MPTLYLTLGQLSKLEAQLLSTAERHHRLSDLPDRDAAGAVFGSAKRPMDWQNQSHFEI